MKLTIEVENDDVMFSTNGERFASGEEMIVYCASAIAAMIDNVRRSLRMIGATEREIEITVESMVATGLELSRDATVVSGKITALPRTD